MSFLYFFPHPPKLNCFNEGEIIANIHEARATLGNSPRSPQPDTIKDAHCRVIQNNLAHQVQKMYTFHAAFLSSTLFYLLNIFPQISIFTMIWLQALCTHCTRHVNSALSLTR